MSTKISKKWDVNICRYMLFFNTQYISYYLFRSGFLLFNHSKKIRHSKLVRRAAIKWLTFAWTFFILSAGGCVKIIIDSLTGIHWHKPRKCIYLEILRSRGRCLTDTRYSTSSDILASSRDKDILYLYLYFVGVEWEDRRFDPQNFPENQWISFTFVSIFTFVLLIWTTSMTYQVVKFLKYQEIQRSHKKLGFVKSRPAILAGELQNPNADQIQYLE